MSDVSMGVYCLDTIGRVRCDSSWHNSTSKLDRSNLIGLNLIDAKINPSTAKMRTTSGISM
jgi:hypothetical protein